MLEQFFVLVLLEYDLRGKMELLLVRVRSKLLESCVTAISWHLQAEHVLAIFIGHARPGRGAMILL